MPAPWATHRESPRRRRAAAQAERFQRCAAGEPELGLHQIHAGDLFGDGVLDLDAGVALDEEVLAGLGHDEELDGAGVAVAGRARQREGVGEDTLPQRRVEPRRRRDLHHLLVADLHRAVALVEVHHLAVVVGQDLHLDVPGSRNEALQEQAAVVEGGARLGNEAGMQGQRVTGAVDADGFHAEPRHCARDADGDLAPVADEDAIEQCLIPRSP